MKLVKKRPKRSAWEENTDALFGVANSRYRNRDGTYANDPFKRIADMSGLNFHKKRRKK